jgi:hypothetical protein
MSTLLEAVAPSTLSTAAWVVPVGLLVLFLTQKEVVRAFGGPRAAAWMRALDVAIWPLLLVFGLGVLTRLASLLVHLRQPGP